MTPRLGRASPSGARAGFFARAVLRLVSFNARARGAPRQGRGNASGRGPCGGGAPRARHPCGLARRALPPCPRRRRVDPGGALPLTVVAAGLAVRRVSVAPVDVVFVKGLIEASEGLAGVFAEQGGELLLATPREREAELCELLADLEEELRARPVVVTMGPQAAPNPAPAEPALVTMPSDAGVDDGPRAFSNLVGRSRDDHARSPIPGRVAAVAARAGDGRRRGARRGPRLPRPRRRGARRAADRAHGGLARPRRPEGGDLRAAPRRRVRSGAEGADRGGHRERRRRPARCAPRARAPGHRRGRREGARARQPPLPALRRRALLPVLRRRGLRVGAARGAARRERRAHRRRASSTTCPSRRPRSRR